MKKLLIILIVILMTVLLTGQEKEIINDNDLKDWNKLTDKEKWESYKTAHNSYVELKGLYDKKTNNETILLNDLEKTNKLLNQRELKNGWSLFVLPGLYWDNYTTKEFKIRSDCYAGFIYTRYLFYNRVYIFFGGAVKFYDSWGGGIIAGLGGNF